MIAVIEIIVAKEATEIEENREDAVDHRITDLDGTTTIHIPPAEITEHASEKNDIAIIAETIEAGITTAILGAEIIAEMTGVVEAIVISSTTDEEEVVVHVASATMTVVHAKIGTNLQHKHEVPKQPLLHRSHDNLLQI